MCRTRLGSVQKLLFFEVLTRQDTPGVHGGIEMAIFFKEWIVFAKEDSNLRFAQGDKQRSFVTELT